MVTRRYSQLLVFQVWFSFYSFIILLYNFTFVRFSDSNTCLDTKIPNISLRFDGLEITLVWFCPLFTRFPLCLHFTFLSLTVARGAIFKILCLFLCFLLFRPPKQPTIKVQTMKAQNYITRVILWDIFMQS